MNSSGQTVRSFGFIVRVRPSGVVTVFGHNLLLSRAKSCGKTVGSCSAIVGRCPGFLLKCRCETRTHEGVKSIGNTSTSRFGILGTRLSGRGKMSPGGRATSGARGGGAHGGSSGGVGGCHGVIITSGRRKRRGCGDSCHKHIRSGGIGVIPRPVFILACCRGRSSIGQRIGCCGFVRALGGRGMLPNHLVVAGRRTPLARRRTAGRFTSVSRRATTVITSPGSIGGHFTHSLSFCLIRSFTDTVRSLGRTVVVRSRFFPICFGHTLVHCGRLRCRGVRGRCSLGTNPKRGDTIGTTSCRVMGHSLSGIIRLTPSFICTCCGENGILSVLGSCHTTVISCSETVRLSPGFTSTCFGHNLARVFLNGGERNVRSLDGTNRLKLFSTCGVVGHFARQGRWRFFTGGEVDRGSFIVFTSSE